MNNRIVFFSGGLSSFAVAHHLKTTYPNDNIVLYFTDTKWEDEDLYRFIREASDKLKLPLLVHSEDIDPVQLMIKQKILFSSRMGNCSTYLKMKVAANFIKKKQKPKTEYWINPEYLKSYDFLENPTLYFGISFDEFHRTVAIMENWKPFDVEFPLCKTFYDYDELLALYKINKPRLYLKGFTHNNCKGRCVKAGIGHFKLLYNEDYPTFIWLEHVETTLSRFVDTYHQYKDLPDMKDILITNEQRMNEWHANNCTGDPMCVFAKEKNTYSFIKGMPLKNIRLQMDQGMKLNLFNEEMGGCGCFVDYENE